MKYVRLKVEFKDYPDKLNRTLLVRKDLDLFTLGVCILTSLEATYEHCFLFEDKKRTYNPEAFEDLYEERDVFMTDYHYYDLVLDRKKQFTLEYDTGDGWDFIITELEEVDVRSRRLVFLEDGKGLGIWEDNIYSLWAFLDGRVKGSTTTELEKEGITLPWNLKLTKFSDFNKKLPIKRLNDEINDHVLYDLDALEKGGCF